MQDNQQQQAPDRLISKNFALLCLASFSFFSSMYFLLPALPLYIVQLGGQDRDVGLIMGAFTLTSILVRPFVGRWVDAWGRKPFLLLGASIFLAASLAYNLARNIPLLLLTRGFHGLGIACFTTAASTYVADIVSPRRRGAAIGYFGMFANVAMSIGPYLGGMLMRSLSLTALFGAAATMGGMAMALASPLRESRRPSPGRNPHEPQPLISRQAVFPALVMFSMTFTYGGVLSFLPLLAVRRQIEGFEAFFTVLAMALILVRAVGGEMSDRFGRAAVIIPGMFLVSLATVTVSLADSLPILLLAAAVYGMGFGAVHPSLLAFTVDRTEVASRGAAMGTFSAAFDLGIGLGSVLLGYILQWGGFTAMYLTAAGVVLLGLIGFSIKARFTLGNGNSNIPDPFL